MFNSVQKNSNNRDEPILCIMLTCKKCFIRFGKKYLLPTYLPTYLGAVISFSAIVCDDKPIKSQMMSLRMIPIEKILKFGEAFWNHLRWHFQYFGSFLSSPFFAQKRKCFHWVSNLVFTSLADRRPA